MFFNPSLKRMSIFTGAALLAGVTAFAQPPGGGGPPGGAPPGGGPPGNSMQQQPGAPSLNNPNNSNQNYNINQQMVDKAFVQEALGGGMAEVQLGQLAAQKGSADDVKQFGQKMVDDHTQLNNAMLKVAQQVGVKPPKKLPKKDKQLMDKLQGLSGSQFDNAYITAMVKDHKKDKEDFRQEASQAQIPQVKQAAQQGTQVIAGHLQLIERIAQAHNLEHGE